MYYGSEIVDRIARGSRQMQWAPGRCWMCSHQMAALLCMKWHHKHHLESVMSNRKSDPINQCIFTWGTIMLSFSLIRFDIMGP